MSESLRDGPEVAAITPAQAERILANAELRTECERMGVDLSLIVSNLLLTVEQRWARHQEAYTSAMAFYRMGREMGLHR